VTVKVEVYRTHVYSADEAAALTTETEQSAASAAMNKAAAERAAQGQVGPAL